MAEQKLRDLAACRFERDFSLWEGFSPRAFFAIVGWALLPDICGGGY